MANVSAGRICVCAEAKLLRVEEEDVQALVRTDERADEGTIVVYDYAKSAAEDAVEVLNRLGVSHIIDQRSRNRAMLLRNDKSTKPRADEPVREQRRLGHARPIPILEYSQVLRHPSHLQRAQEPAHHHMAARQGVY